MPESARDALADMISRAQQYAYQSPPHYQLSKILGVLDMAVVLEEDKAIQSWCLAVQDATSKLRSAMPEDQRGNQ